MTATSDKQVLTGLDGKLSEGFRGVALRELEERIVKAQPEPEREKAAGIIGAFYEAAERLKERESAFDRGAKPGHTGLDLKANLREPEHVAAMRDFHAARQDLLALSGTLGLKMAKIIGDVLTDQTIFKVAQRMLNTQTLTGTRGPGY
ncbi:MAG: hypothetical protein GC185_08050 [Alphaproteobacteria bacterium]|nr:hypothetical protein [Alphaproteobacteria bacterium]